MGVELVIPEPNSVFSLTALAIGVVLSIIFLVLIRVFPDSEPVKSKWKLTRGDVPIFLIVTVAMTGIFGLMNRPLDTEARDAVQATQEALEEHYSVNFVGGHNSFTYDTRSDEQMFFDVDFATEEGEVYQGRVDVIDGMATLAVSQDMELGQYTEYDANAGVVANESVSVVEFNVLKDNSNLIAFVVFVMIVVGFILAWKFEAHFQSERVLSGHDDFDAGPKYWRWLIWGVLISAGFSVVMLVVPLMSYEAHKTEEAASETLSKVEESYGVQQIKNEGDYDDYTHLRWDNGLHSVSFVDDKQPMNGYLRTVDGEVSLYVLEHENEVDYVEYDEKLLN